MQASTTFLNLPLPSFFNPEDAGQVWRVPYQERAAQARAWAKQYAIPPAANDSFKIGLALVDVQNTFCLPDFELFVGGVSGQGAVEDSRRLAAFIYRNLGNLTHISATLDTHQAMQIFHSVYLIDPNGEPPPANTMVTVEDVRRGRWRFNPLLAPSLGIQPEEGQRQLEDYTSQLQDLGKYELTIWPYHAMLGGIGHALVPLIEEAVFFHTLARLDQPDFLIKGENPQTENYSAIQPEVLRGPDGEILGQRDERLLSQLEACDALVIAGQAKSHCVAWTIDDLLANIQRKNPALARKVYLLDDCSSAVVIPGVVDFSSQAEAAYAKFAAAGMHRVLSTEPMESWPGLAKS